MTQADLDGLFIDLPMPGRAAEPSAPDSTGVVASGTARGFLESKRETIMALMPFAALMLFFLAGYQWMWFLMVPVMGILLYGPDGGKNAGHGRDRGRNRGR